MPTLYFLSYVIWHPDPRVFPPLEMPRWYGVLFAAGLLISYQIMLYIYKKEEKPQKEVDLLAAYILIAALVGARLGHILFYEPIYYLAHPIEILPIRMEPEFQFVGLAGLASHGGAIGILIALYLYSKKKKAHYLWVLDRVVIVVALTGCFIRLGNLMNSEIIGTPATVPWAFIFSRVDEVPRHPAQVYEALYCLLLFFLLFYLWKMKRKKFSQGFITGLFLTILFTLRFVDEFFKINQVSFEKNLPINMGQILSIPFVMIGLLLLLKNVTFLNKQ
jgi:phosphatidylglycerol---prolipoprotein diacylglyceryl transferase